jgi:hypothetical protein
MYKFEIASEEVSDLTPYVKTSDLLSALNAYAEFLRTKIKYGDLDKKIEEVYSDCRAEFFNILKEYDCLELIP